MTVLNYEKIANEWAYGENENLPQIFIAYLKGLSRLDAEIELLLLKAESILSGNTAVNLFRLETLYHIS